MKKGLVYAFIVILLDQISKIAVLQYFASHPENVRVTSFFNIILAWNKGVSFSMFHTDREFMQWVLITLSLAICCVIVHWMKMEKDQKTVNCFGLILGGALGNVIDRLHYRAVVDFLDFHIGSYHWPAFNIADSAICVGAVFILVWNIFIIHPEPASVSAEKGKDNVSDS